MLFDSTKIGGIDASCRIVRSATFEGMADSAGHPSNRLIQTYEALAEGGVGIIITGMMAISSMEPYQHNQIRVDTDDCIAPLQELTRRVHAKGGKIIAQIVLMGSAILLPEGENRTIISPSGIPEKNSGSQTSHEVTAAEIERLIADAAQAALRVQKAGFDGLQFHGAHGYLPSKFLTPYYNQRTDEYGGSLENRARFLRNCLAAIRAAVGNSYPVWVKMNCSDFMEKDGMTFEDSRQVMEWLAADGITAIEISGGNTSSLPRQGPIRAIRRTKEPMYFYKYAQEIASLLKGQTEVGVVGGFRNAADMENCLQQSDLAFISLCRPLLRQPDLPTLWRNGSTEPALCISCSRCFGAENVDCIFNKPENQ
jgi:2,4-dienoyl-CoA reductase-like NADH-dependent reductase (Old Yellow Enzyme family)